MDRKLAAGELAALDRDPAAMLLHDLSCTGKSDSGSGNHRGVYGSPVALKDVRQIGLRDANTLVSNGERGPGNAIFDPREPHVDDSSVRAVLDCVGDQIVYDPLDSPGIPNAGQFVVPIVHHELVALGCLLVHLDNAMDQRSQIASIDTKLKALTCPQSGHVRKLFDSPVHARQPAVEYPEHRIDRFQIGFAGLDPPPQQLRLGLHRRQRVLHIVSDICDKVLLEDFLVLAVGNVDIDPEHSHRPALLVVEGLASHIQPALVPTGIFCPVLDVVWSSFLEGAANRFRHHLPIIGMNLFEKAPECARSRTESLLGGLRPDQGVGLHIPVPGIELTSFQCERQSFRRLP